MGRLFGTDGIRGEANRYPLDGPTAFSMGQAITRFLKKGRKEIRIIIGRDTRITGEMLERSLESGIMSMGGTPCPVGVLPTPGIAYMARVVKADAGIVISASHNPYQDNGIKLFFRQRIEDDRQRGRIHRGSDTWRKIAGGSPPFQRCWTG